MTFGDGQPAAQASNQTPTPQTQPPADSGIPEWAKGLDASIVNEPSIRLHKDIGSLAKSYINAQKMVGANKVILPTKESTPEVWQDFYRKAGLPETIEKYEVSKKQDSKLDDVLFTTLKDRAYKAGVLPHQFDELGNGLEEYVTNHEKVTMAKMQEIKQKNLESLKTEFGDAYNAKMQLANQALDLFADESVKQALVKSGLSHDPAVIKMFAKLGTKLGEHKMIEGTPADSSSPADLQGEVDSYMKDMNSPYYNKAHPAHFETVKKVQALFKRIHK